MKKIKFTYGAVDPEKGFPYAQKLTRKLGGFLGDRPDAVLIERVTISVCSAPVNKARDDLKVLVRIHLTHKMGKDQSVFFESSFNSEVRKPDAVGEALKQQIEEGQEKLNNSSLDEQIKIMAEAELKDLRKTIGLLECFAPERRPSF